MIFKIKIVALAMMSVMVFAVTPGSAMAVTVDGFMSDNEYSNSFSAGWYNGHGHGTQYTKDNAGNGVQNTQVYYENTETNFYLYIEAPLEVKNMIWGTGFSDAEAELYYQMWCSPSSGTAAADGGNCTHHTDGLDVFKNGGKNSKGKWKKPTTGYAGMTHSEKLIFGDAGPIESDHEESDHEESDHEHHDKHSDGANATSVTLDLAGSVSGNIFGAILDFKDSVDYVTNYLGCDLINCDASNIPMAFELEFAALNLYQIDKLIDAIQYSSLEFHLSPERGGTLSPVPLPAAFWLFGSALVGFVGVSRRRKIA